MGYDIFGVSVKGASHIISGLACQDYCLIKETKRGKLFALSDGHGNPNFFRSDIGARLICEIAVEILDGFADDIYSEALLEAFFKKPQKFFERISVGIIGKWLCAVEKDATEKEFSEEELAVADKYGDCYRQGKNPEYAYGCTLIAGVLTKDFLLLVQQGDGRCVVFDGEGRASQPVPWDERCIGNITTSCCDEDAFSSCRFSVIDLKEQSVIACMAATDGLVDSFPSMKSLYSYMRLCVKDICEKGRQSFEKEMKKSLTELSESGSTDDITICGFIDIENASSVTDKFIKMNEASALEDELRATEEKIHSILNGGRLQYLEDSYEKAVEEYGDCKKRSEALLFALHKAERLYCLVKIKSQTKNNVLKMALRGIPDVKACADILNKKITVIKESITENEATKKKTQYDIQRLNEERVQFNKKLEELIEKRERLYKKIREQ